MFNFFKKEFKDETPEEQLKDLLTPQGYMEKAVNGLSCDSLPGATGEFGRAITNPIPVNGPDGEIKYLNRLRTSDGGLIFHRLGSNNAIDVYEVVSIGGKVWDILYFDMYHPRRSTKLPKGYTFNEFDEIFSRSPIGYCTNSFDPNFPFGMSKIIQERIGGSLGVKFAQRYESFIAHRDLFARPQAHKNKMSLITLNAIANKAKKNKGTLY